MTAPITVRVTHHFNVPAERVYDAWITPTQAARFLFATRTGNVLHCEIDARVGGQFSVTDRRPNADTEESFFDAEHRGTYVELDRPGRITFDFSVEPFSDQATRVTIDILPMGAQMCDLVLTHAMGDSPEAKANEKRTRQGWTNMLAQLEKVLTTRTWGGLGGFKTPGST